MTKKEIRWCILWLFISFLGSFRQAHPSEDLPRIKTMIKNGTPENQKAFIDSTSGMNKEKKIFLRSEGETDSSLCARPEEGPTPQKELDVEKRTIGALLIRQSSDTDSKHRSDPKETKARTDLKDTQDPKDSRQPNDPEKMKEKDLKDPYPTTDLKDPKDHNQKSETHSSKTTDALLHQTIVFVPNPQSDTMKYFDVDRYKSSEQSSPVLEDKTIKYWNANGGDIRMDHSSKVPSMPQLELEGKTSISDKEFFDLRDAMYDSSAEKGAEKSKDGPVRTYNLIITKEYQKESGKPILHYLPNKEVERMTGEDPSRGSMDDMKHVRNAVHSAVTAVVGSNEQFQEALTQVTEEPGKGSVVTIINSTIPSLSELESTIQSLLGSSIIFEEDRAKNTAIGYLPRNAESVIRSLLNQTVGLKYPPQNEGIQRNVINIFIINILERQSQNESPSDGSVHGLDLGSLPLLPDSLADQPSKNDDSVVKEKDERDIMLHVYNMLKRLNTTTTSSSSPTGSETLSHQFHHSTIEKIKGFPQQFQSYSKKKVDKPPNPYGLDLNQNTVLNLLPSFVRATTIPPVVPLHNASLYKNLGLRPSVLGLLPNDVFGLSNLKIPLLRNSSKGGIIRKDLIANLSVLLDKFTQRQLEDDQFSMEKDPLENSLSLTNLAVNTLNIPNNDLNTLNANNAKNSREKQLQDSGVSIPTRGIQRSTLPKESLNEYSVKPSPDNLFELLKHHTKTENSKIKKMKGNTKENNSGLVNIFHTDKSEGEANSLSKVMTRGALPGGIAFATALFPFWAPYVFGKRRKRETVSMTDAKRNEFPEDIALDLLMSKIRDLQGNLIQTYEEDTTTFIPTTDSDTYLDEENLTTEVSAIANDDEILVHFLEFAMNELEDKNNETDLQEVPPITVSVHNNTESPEMSHISIPVQEHSG